jgi:hypothetical protein
VRILGIVLIVIGTLTLAYKGWTYNKERTVLDVGGLKATVEEKKTVPFSPIAGALSLAVGVVLVVADRRHA